MLIGRGVLERIACGEVTLAFRRWRRPTVRAGGTLRTAVGVLAISSVRVVDPARISLADARRAGYLDLSALLVDLADRRGAAVYRIELRRSGEDPRLRLRAQSRLSLAERAALGARLARLDARRAWTDATLREIAARPGVRAADLAERLGRERKSFKTDVRKLKELGLTESLEVGYRLSPRGRAWLRGTRQAGK